MNNIITDSNGNDNGEEERVNKIIEMKEMIKRAIEVMIAAVKASKLFAKSSQVASYALQLEFSGDTNRLLAHEATSFTLAIFCERPESR